MTEGYDVIAGVYDKLNAEINYNKWADFIEECFDKYLDNRPELVLDLACGTGSMTLELARRGYDMIGVDGSDQMLSVASERYYDEDFGDEPRSILFLLQDMRSFELYGTVGACVCCLDSINYLLTEDDVKKCFRTVHNYLDPDGIFMFDVNSTYKFENVYSDNAYILEDELDGGGIYCGWQNLYSDKSKICDFYLTLFSENEDGTYTRSEEHQRERMYTCHELEAMLTECGFDILDVCSDYSGTQLSEVENSERWYFVARAKK